MEAHAFVTWLKGYFEISGEELTKKLTEKQVERIRQKLASVADPAEKLDPPELESSDRGP
jgi:hypothetical protein